MMILIFQIFFDLFYFIGENTPNIGQTEFINLPMGNPNIN